MLPSITSACTPTRAAKLAGAYAARAFALGGDLVFGSNAWSPSTTSGVRLLAHETVHALQHPVVGSASSTTDAATQELEALIGAGMPAVKQLSKSRPW